MSPWAGLEATMERNRKSFQSTKTTLWLRRVENQVPVDCGGFVLGQVDKDGHLASVRRWWRTYGDGSAVGNFPDEVGEVHSRRKGRERWNRAFQDLLGVWVWPARAMANVTGGFYDVL